MNKQQQIASDGFANLIGSIEDRMAYHNAMMEASKQVKNYEKYMEHSACYSELMLIKTLCETNQIITTSILGRE